MARTFVWHRTRGPKRTAKEAAPGDGKLRIKQVRSAIGHSWRFRQTLAALAGITAPADLHGRSLVPLLRDAQAPWNYAAVSQVRRGAVPGTFMGYSLRTDRWRYTEWDGGARGTELYDAQADPDEVRNVATDPAHRDTVTDLQGRLRRIIAAGALPGRNPGRRTELAYLRAVRSSSSCTVASGTEISSRRSTPSLFLVVIWMSMD